jgi:hypothetical protein
VNIADILVDAVAFNKDFNFGQLLTCTAVYFLLFWLAVSIWVYKDAQRRYVNSDPRTPLLIAIFVFFLFFPALIFYLAVRPTDNDLDFLGYGDGGVNVPIVNFLGKDGVSMTLELNIHKTPEQLKEMKGMKIDVKWDSKDEQMAEMKREEKHKDDIGSRFWNKVDEKRKMLKQRFKKIQQKFTKSNEPTNKKEAKK